jgi:hypothetical protein
MKRLAVFAALSLLASFCAQAEPKVQSFKCDFDSHYKFSQQGRTLIFSQDTAPGKSIMIQDSRLVIDGKELLLSTQDKQRVGEFENEMRLLIPQLKQVTSEAVDIAFAALIEVSRGLNAEQNNDTVKKLKNAQIAVHRSFANNPAQLINGDIDDKIIEPIVTDFVPELVSAAVKQALSLAFSGDQKTVDAFEARMKKMGDDIDATVKVKAKNLEPLAEAMCQRMRKMDKIEDSFNLRLSNKEKINLFDTQAP